MTAGSKENLTTFPPFDSHEKRQHGKRDSPLELDLSDDMAGEPFIKPEPSDHLGFDPNQYMQYHPHGQHPSFGTSSSAMNVNPANLSGGNGSFGQFNMGNAGIADDELLDLQIDQQQHPNGGYDFNQGMAGFQNQQAVSHHSGMFSHTPDGAPLNSPFNDFNFSQFRPMGQQHQHFAGGHSLPQQSGNGFRPHMQHLNRKVSDSRSPATPNLQIGVGDDFAHPGMQQIQQHRRQQGSVGNGWDSTPSGHSWNESSPFPSPANGQPMHAQISEVLKNTGHHHKVASSLPAKMEGGSGPGIQTQEAKRRRRRESHNAVERRRRDNINERIHDLGTLVPQHRLEDEKVRKHLLTNAPLSPSIANAGLSPPNATSLLAGGQGRRATSSGSGTITQGLPMDDKEKGPNKGDILNGSVAWAHDLMWYTHLKLRQEQELKELIQQLGGVWPFEQTEDEKRMHSEICEILNKHASLGGFTDYTRAAGSGLRVPGFTNVSGDAINSDGNGYPHTAQQSLSPGFQSGGSGMSSGQMSHQQQNQFWNGELKEEDEWTNMEMQ